MLTSGGRIEFEASAHCYTYAPEDLATFYKQVTLETYLALESTYWEVIYLLHHL